MEIDQCSRQGYILTPCPILWGMIGDSNQPPAPEPHVNLILVQERE